MRGPPPKVPVIPVEPENLYPVSRWEVVLAVVLLSVPLVLAGLLFWETLS